MRESLEMICHVQRRAINTPVGKSELIQVKTVKKGKRSPKITLVEIVKKDKSIKEVIESIILDNTEWKKIIHMTEPN